MYLVQQISRYHCFPACLVSFFRYLKLPLEQEEIVNRLPELFFRGEEKEGAFTNSDENFNQVANELNIEINTKLKGQIYISEKSTLFFFVRWENNPNDNHCVRFYKQEHNNIYFMNPNTGKIENIKAEIFNSWITKAALITKV